ncbi:protein translocase subunit SecD [Candidatus Woesearchaeota archaeon]|nr:protein translocase subunit SecD [Candidatus Woesearchaeota archaeon]
MMKKLLKEWRVIVLLLFLFFSYLAIGFNLDKDGVAIVSVEANSMSDLAGIKSPPENLNLVKRERIIAINDAPVNNINDYTSLIEKNKDSLTFKIKTNKEEYTLINDINKSIGIEISNVASNNLRKGLDLQGGTRVLLKPLEDVSSNDIKDIIDVMENRLNVYGLSDLTIREASDLAGEKYISVEIAGASKEEVKDLITKQGVFEARIGDNIVFRGGEEDITFVCRHDGTCSRIIDCLQVQGGYNCKFEFEIALSEAAANKHAEITKDLAVNVSQGMERFLEKSLDLYLDGAKVDSLLISSDLKGEKADRIIISGPGFGVTQEDAVNDAIFNRNKLQTILITGSLPTKLEIIKLDSISPLLGKEFLNNSLLIAILALIGVGLIVYLRYRNFKIVLPIIFTVSSEIFIILGLAALFKYNLDLAAIVGLIAAVGTGVDDQIVITDEMLSGSSSNDKERLKSAFFIIFSAFAATVAAMIPLFWAGAGLLTGFALVTIAGVTIGVFITRPAYAVIIKFLLKD